MNEIAINFSLAAFLKRLKYMRGIFELSVWCALRPKIPCARFALPKHLTSGLILVSNLMMILQFDIIYAFMVVML